MTPNSSHQVWSKWTIVVRPDRPFSPTFEMVKTNAARFLRKAFGSAAQCRIVRGRRAWLIEVLADAAHAHPQDTGAFVSMSRDLTRFFRNGFGESANVRVKARLMAGERLDGQAPDQLLVLPALPMPVLH